MKKIRIKHKRKKNKKPQIYVDTYSNNQKELVDKINKASSLIHNRQGSGQYIICSAQIANFIQNLDIKVHRKKKLKKLESLMNENKKASE